MNILMDAICARQISNLNKFPIQQSVGEIARSQSGGMIPIGKHRSLVYEKPSKQAVTFKEINGAPFALIEDKKLRNMGVPDYLIEVVHNIPNFDAISNLPLEDGVKDRLEYWLTQHKKSLEASLLGIQYSTDVDHLLRYHRKDVTQLLLHLHDDQRKLVNKVGKKSPIIIKGAVGSGKTTIALYRMLEQAKKDANCLYLTYNVTLIESATSLIKALDGKVRNGIQIRNIHRLCSEFLREEAGVRLNIINDKWYRNSLISKAIKAGKGRKKSKLFDRDLLFWKHEIDAIIKGRAKADFSTYMTIERTGIGAGGGLDRNARELVWNVFNEYENLRGNQYDYVDFPLFVLDHMKRSPGYRKYDYVFIDEAQDFTRAMMEVAINLCKHPGNIFVVADAAQSIYQQGFRWKDVNLNVGGGNVSSLAKNHRNTIEILRAAQDLIHEVPDLQNCDEYIEPEQSSRHGLKPKIMTFEKFGDQIQWIVMDIEKRRRTGECLEKNIAIFSKKVDDVKRIFDELRKKNIPCTFFKDSMDINAPTVKCSTLHSSKGLEFPLVYVLGVDQKRIPGYLSHLSDDEIHLREINEMKLLYVGMTRAMNELIITCNSMGGSNFIHHIGKEKYQLLGKMDIEKPNSVSRMIDRMEQRNPKSGHDAQSRILKQLSKPQPTYEVCPTSKKKWKVCKCPICALRRRAI